MAANLTQRLQFLISANSDEAIRVFQKTGATAEKELGRADKSIDKAAANLTKFGAGAMAFAGVAGGVLVKAGMNFTNLGVQVGKFSDATGIATDASSRFIEVAGDVGVSTETLQGAIVKMEKAVASSPEAFDRLGISIAYASDGSVDAGETFIRTADALGKIEDPTKRAQAASEIFGRGFTGVAELIEMGADDMRAAMAGVSDTKIFTPEEVAESREMRAAMDELTDSFQEIGLTIGQAVLPVMETVAGVITDVTGAFRALPGPVQDAAGSIMGVGTVALGAVGALSFVTGQVIKMRDNLAPLTSKLRDSEGGLTGMGKAAKGAGIALASIAAADVVFSVMNDIGDAAGNVERKLQALNIALGNTEGSALDGEAAMSAFRDSVAAEGKGLRFQNLWEDVGKEITLVGGSIGRNIEEIDRAFGKLLDSSPRQAQELLNIWAEQNAALNTNSQQYKDNAMLLERYQSRVDLAVGSSAALTGETDDLAYATDGAAGALDDAALAGDRYREVIAELYDEMKSQTQATLDYEGATIGLAQSYDDYIEKLREANADGTITREELLDIGDAMVGLKGDVLGAAEAFAEQQGAAEGSQESINLQIEELERQKALYPELTGFIDQYIGTLQRIPSQVSTELLVSINDGGFFDGGVYDSGGGYGSRSLSTQAAGDRPQIMGANSLWQRALSAWGAARSGADSQPKETKGEKKRREFAEAFDKAQRKYEVGDYTADEYLAELRRLRKKYTFRRLSDPWMTLWREIQRVEDEIEQARREAEEEAIRQGAEAAEAAGQPWNFGTAQASADTMSTAMTAGGRSAGSRGGKGGRGGDVHIHLKGFFLGSEAEMRKAVRPLVPAIGKELDRWERGQ